MIYVVVQPVEYPTSVERLPQLDASLFPSQHYRSEGGRSRANTATPKPSRTSKMMTSTYAELYGPQDPSILTCQNTHRSESIVRGKIKEDETLRVNQLIGNIFWTFRIDDPNRVRLHPRVLDLLYDMSFYHVARCGAMVIDAHLITALVERWRPETHTFHFPIGEATITLQDVAIIWGLHIDGEPLKS
ncbi:hypothetical protein ACS0TY_032747 [Phlomoides rotata]